MVPVGGPDKYLLQKYANQAQCLRKLFTSEIKPVEPGSQGEKLGFAQWIEECFPGDYAKCGSQFHPHFNTAC